MITRASLGEETEREQQVQTKKFSDVVQSQGHDSVLEVQGQDQDQGPDSQPPDLHGQGQD